MKAPVLLFFSFLGLTVNAQEDVVDSIPKKSKYFAGIYGTFGVVNQSGNVGYFQSRYPEATFFNKDLSLYEVSDSWGNLDGFAGVFGFDLWTNERSFLGQGDVRFEVSSLNRTRGMKLVYLDEQITDTLYSSNGMDTIAHGYSWLENVNLEESRTFLQLGAAIKTEVLRHNNFAFTLGVGVLGGIGTRSYFEEKTVISQSEFYGEHYVYSNTINEFEKVRVNQTLYALGAYARIGFLFQNFFMEFQPQFTTIMGGTETPETFFSGGFNIGVQYYFDKAVYKKSTTKFPVE